MGSAANTTGFQPWPSVSFLGRLPEPVRATMLTLGTRVVLAAHRPVLQQGEKTTHSFLLLSGCVKTVASGDDGTTESLLSIRIRGEVVGEMAALSERPRSASVITCSESAARVIQAAELNAFLTRHPVAAIELARMISERLRWANERRVDFAALSARDRICRVLAELMVTYGRSTPDGWELGNPLTQAEVASLAGVRLPTAEKVLRSLREQGVVLLRYRRIVVTDLDALAQPATD